MPHTVELMSHKFLAKDIVLSGNLSVGLHLTQFMRQP
jgi:hypothetical protein